MEKELDKAKELIEQCRIILDALTLSLTPAIIYDSGVQHFGFRYMKPNERNYCLIKAVRAASAINAMIVLAEKGFNQELCVLARTVDECLTQIQYVLSGINEQGIAAKQKKFIDKFFQDYKRNSADDFDGSTIRQKDIHDDIEKYYDALGVKSPSNKTMSDLKSNIYRTFSNYVHAYYPEVMDMYGGKEPYKFHMNGMSGTPKDKESIEIINTFTNSVILTVASMISKFQMIEELIKDPRLADWFKKE